VILELGHFHHDSPFTNELRMPKLFTVSFFSLSAFPNPWAFEQIGLM
jgi:hypothetical protein